jgi:regulator of replication initiation timing
MTRHSRNEIYINQLETEIMALSKTIDDLVAENYALKQELEDRGYTVDKEDASDYLHEVITWYKRGNVKEALIKLERIEPQLFGISEKVK